MRQVETYWEKQPVLYDDCESANDKDEEQQDLQHKSVRTCNPMAPQLEI